jgi:hypothetical protein
MVPVVGGPLAELWTYAQDLDRWRVQQMGQALRDCVGDDDLLIERLKDNERLLDMLVEAGEAARGTSWEAKRIAMGRVLAHAISDDADIDYDAALLSALAALEAVHLRYIAQIADANDKPMPPQAGHLVLEPYRSHLIAQGVLELGTTYDGDDAIVGISEFGLRLMAWIRDAEQNPPQPPEVEDPEGAP